MQVKTALKEKYSDKYINSDLLLLCTDIPFSQVNKYEKVVQGIVKELISSGADLSSADDAQVNAILDKHSEIVGAMKQGFEDRERVF